VKKYGEKEGEEQGKEGQVKEKGLQTLLNQRRSLSTLACSFFLVRWVSLGVLDNDTFLPS